MKTNTVFEVVKQTCPDARTAWADKHAWGYDWLNGPSGNGVDDLARTEINSIDPATNTNYTDVYTHTEIFDNLHVQSLINRDRWQGFDRAIPRRRAHGVRHQLPDAERCPEGTVATGGGYMDASFTPGPQVAGAIDLSGQRVGPDGVRTEAAQALFVDGNHRHGEAWQSPTDHSKLVKNGDTLSKLLEANQLSRPEWQLRAERDEERQPERRHGSRRHGHGSDATTSG